MSKQIDSESMELLSARFADLIAQEQQSRWLDQIGRLLFTSADKESLIANLASSLTQRAGFRRQVFLAQLSSDIFEVQFEQGGLVPKGKSVKLDTQYFRYLSEDSLPKPFLEPQQREFLELLQNALKCPEIGTYYFLREGRKVFGLWLVDREPMSYVLRDFSSRLVERAAQALCLVSARHQAKSHSSSSSSPQLSAPKSPTEASELPRPVLHWIEEWSKIAALQVDRCSRLEQMLQSTVDELGADKGSLMLYEESSGELVVRAVVGVEPEVAAKVRNGQQDCLKLKLGSGVAGVVAQTLRPLLVNEADKDPVFLEPGLSLVGSILCLPLHVNGLLLGVLNLTHRQTGKKFSADQLASAMSLADLLSQAINNSRLYHLAVLEPQTEVFHRFHLYNRAEDEICRARRYQRHVSLLAVQFRNWSELRQRLGNHFCNQMEKALAEILKQATRDSDSVGRLSDGSFGVLLPETDSLGAIFTAERLHQMVDSDAVFRSHGLHTSLGVATFPDRAESVTSLFMRAESAMRSAGPEGNQSTFCLAPAASVVENPFLKVASY